MGTVKLCEGSLSAPVVRLLRRFLSSQRHNVARPSPAAGGPVISPHNPHLGPASDGRRTLTRQIETQCTRWLASGQLLGTGFISVSVSALPISGVRHHLQPAPAHHAQPLVAAPGLEPPPVQVLTTAQYSLALYLFAVFTYPDNIPVTDDFIVPLAV